MPDPYYEPPSPTAEDTLLSRLAAGWVQKLAPVPSPEPADYADLAEAAEYAVFNWLKRTQGGTLTAQGARGLSATYASHKEAVGLVAPVMGPYYTGPTRGLRIVDIERA